MEVKTNILSAIIVSIFILGLIFLGYLHKRKASLNIRIIYAFVLSISLGLILQFLFGQESVIIKNLLPLFSFVSRFYTTLLRLLVVPILLLNIILVIYRLHQSIHSKYFAQVTSISTGILLLNTALASFLGIGVAVLLKTGGSINISALEAVSYKYQYKGFLDAVLGFLPKNIFATLSSSNGLQVTILAVLIGIATALTSKKNPSLVSPFIKSVESLNEIVKDLVSFVISLTPYGVYALLVRSLVSNQWVSLFTTLGSFVLANLVGFVVLFIWQVLVASVLSKHSPFVYVAKIAEALFVVFSTRSSFSTIPVTSRVLNKNFKLHTETSNTIPSIAASISMNACAGLWPAIVATTTLVALGQPITPLLVLLIAGANTVAFIGVSGIPGTATVAASASFSLLGIPFTLVPLVQSVDFFIDMGRTALNVHGGISAAVTADAILYKQEESTPTEESLVHVKNTE